MWAARRQELHPGALRGLPRRFFDYRRYLSPGERGTVLIIATNSKQARVIFRYVRALLTHIPMLAKLIERETTDSFDLNNGATIEVHPVSMKTTRGYTIVAALCDEIAFWPHEDAAEPDYEVLNALRPGMATIPNAMLLCASSALTPARACCRTPIASTTARMATDPGMAGHRPAR